MLQLLLDLGLSLAVFSLIFGISWEKSTRMIRLCSWVILMLRCGHTAWISLSHHSMGKCNFNSLLMQLCQEFDLALINTWFRQPDKCKATWKHPRSWHSYILDYVAVRHRNMYDIKSARFMCGAECCTNHHLLCAKMSLVMMEKMRKSWSKVTKRINLPQMAWMFPICHSGNRSGRSDRPLRNSY